MVYFIIIINIEDWTTERIRRDKDLHTEYRGTFYFRIRRGG